MPSDLQLLNLMGIQHRLKAAWFTFLIILKVLLSVYFLLTVYHVMSHMAITDLSIDHFK